MLFRSIRVKCQYDEDLFSQVVDHRWHVYEQRPILDVSELFRVMRKVVNTDSSRLSAVISLLETHRRLIVFYNFDYELEILRTLTHKVTVAEWNGHKHEALPDGDRWVYLVQYVAGAEAWDCIETNAMCFYSLTYSYKNWHQAHGRIDRLNTPYLDLYYYTLISSAVIDKLVSGSMKRKKSFNESRFIATNRMLV